jgi:hypothetical protein
MLKLSYKVYGGLASTDSKIRVSEQSILTWWSAEWDATQTRFLDYKHFFCAVILRYVRNHSANDSTSHSKRHASTAQPLCEHRISHWNFLLSWTLWTRGSKSHCNNFTKPKFCLAKYIFATTEGRSSLQEQKPTLFYLVRYFEQWNKQVEFNKPSHTKPVADSKPHTNQQQKNRLINEQQ